MVRFERSQCMFTEGEDRVHAKTFETNMKFGGVGRSALWTCSDGAWAAAGEVTMTTGGRMKMIGEMKGRDLAGVAGVAGVARGLGEENACRSKAQAHNLQAPA